MNDPIVTTLLIVAIFGVSFLAFNDPTVEERFIFRPRDILADKEHYRLVTSSFLHAGWGHLLLNVYALYSYGSAVEMWYGKLQFLLIFFGSVIGGDLLSLFIHRHHDYAAYGASGGVCGVMFAFVLRSPHSAMSIFPLPYTVPGWLFAIGFLVASFYAMKAARDNIGHDAHIGGAMLGLVIAACLDPEVAQRNWIPLVTMLLAGGLIFAYVLVNPLFLPLSAFDQLRWPWPRTRSRNAKRRPAGATAPPRVRTTPRDLDLTPPTSDWLIQEIEVQVGKLERDTSGQHDWVDKFGRTYDVVSGTAEQFNAPSFFVGLTERLKRPGVNFVIVDTRQLTDAQVDQLRPLIAELPDAQFNRLIRSHAFGRKR